MYTILLIKFYVIYRIRRQLQEKVQTNLDFYIKKLYNRVTKQNMGKFCKKILLEVIMKKLLSLALAAAMTLSLGALAVSAETPATGLNATKYESATYMNILVEDYRGATTSFDGNKKFDASIEKQLKASNAGAPEKVTRIEAGNADWYINKWTGTMTAKDAGTYTLIGRKIDNGFAMFVDGVKVYEYWGASHWFDGAGDRQVSNDATFTMTAGQTANVEIYFMELDGGDALEIFATTTPSDPDTGSNINDAFTFDLEKTVYTQKPGFQTLIPRGIGTDGNNGAQCVTENFKFDETIDSIMDMVKKTESKVVDNFRGDGKFGGDNYIVKYTGYMVPKTSGTYTFGATKMDNGFVLKIDGTKAYEMWANDIWNDNGSGNTYPTTIELEAGKAYKLEAYYLELGGGEALEVTATVDGTTLTLEEAFTYYVSNPNGGEEPEPLPPPSDTGDSAVYAVVAIVATLALGAVVVSKRRITE